MDLVLNFTGPIREMTSASSSQNRGVAIPTQPRFSLAAAASSGPNGRRTVQQHSDLSRQQNPPPRVAPPPRSSRPTNSNSAPSAAMQETNRTLDVVFRRLAELDEYRELQAQARKRAENRVYSDVAPISDGNAHSRYPRGRGGDVVRVVGRQPCDEEGGGILSTSANDEDAEKEEARLRVVAERNLRLSQRERQKELERRFEELYRNPHSEFRSKRGVSAEQPSFGRTITRAPSPRTLLQRRRGRQIQEANIAAVRPPSPTHGGGGVGGGGPAGQRLHTSPSRGDGNAKVGEGTTMALRTLSSSPSPPPPRDSDERARLRVVAAQVSKELDAHRSALETKWHRLAALDPVDIKRRTVPRDEDTVQLILRVCAWHVNVAQVRFTSVVDAFVSDRRSTRAARAVVLKRSWDILTRSLFPAVRRWVRRMRLRRFYRWLRCALFVVKLQRRHRARCIARIVPFLRSVAKDRSIAIRRFCSFLRRSVFLVQSAFQRQRARRRLLAQQWIAMETSLLLFHLTMFPDVALIPGWRDEHAALRLKLLHWSSVVRQERHEMSATEGHDVSSRSTDASFISSGKGDPGERGEGGGSATSSIGTHLPPYLQETLCWRQFYVKYRPVGVFEDGPLDRLPRSLALFRATPERRDELIRQFKDSEYRFQRTKALDASITRQRRLRNLEEWRERQRVEVIHRAKNEYHISTDSQLFDIVCEYEMARRERDMAAVTKTHKRHRGREATHSGYLQGMSAAATNVASAPEHLIPEHLLRGLAAEEIQATVQRMKRLRGSGAM